MGLDYYKEGNILLEDYHAIYFFIPKVACSSLKSVCLRLLNAKHTDPDVHNYNYPCARRDLLRDKYADYYKFAFVRNPWDRLFSCYKNKIKEDETYNSNEFRNGVFIKLVKYNLFRAGMPFDEFATAVCQIPDNRSNPHFRSQHTFITDNSGELLVDSLGKFESLEEDFLKLSTKLNVDSVHLPHLMTSGKDDRYTDYYSTEIRELVRKRYNRDITLFGYEW